jgi:hypothetical protein
MFLTSGYMTTSPKTLIKFPSGRQPEMIDVTAWVNHLGHSKIDEIYALSEQVDLNEPIIIAEHEDDLGQVMRIIIDGSHRLYKADHTHIAGASLSTTPPHPERR